MSNARNLSKLLGTDTQITTPDIANGVFQANKNLIINGAMQVAQRGTNITTSVGYTYGIDRWSDYWGMNYLQQTATINGATANTCKFTTQSSNFYLYYRIEDNITKNEVAASYYAGKTLSFWYRSNFAATSIGLFDITTVGDETWRYYTKTFTSTPSKSSEFFEFLGRASGTDYIEMTQVQLEVGDTATPFEHRSYGDELARCQRYYHKIGGSVIYQRYFMASCQGSNFANGTVSFPVKMRSQPSLEHTGTAANYGIYSADIVAACDAVPAISTTGSDENVANVSMRSSSNLTSGRAAEIISNNNANAYLAFSAEI